MKKVFLLFVALFTTAASFAAPCILSGVYVDAFLGFNFVNTRGEQHGHIQYDVGYAVGGAFGYRVSEFLRLEAEGSYRCNNVRLFDFHQNQFGVHGSLKKALAMANGYLELPFYCHAFIPYFGVGVGERWDNTRIDLKPEIVEKVFYNFDKVDEHNHGFAYQVIVGLTVVNFQLLRAAMEYRFLDGPDIQCNHTVNLCIDKYF